VVVPDIESQRFDHTRRESRVLSDNKDCWSVCLSSDMDGLSRSLVAYIIDATLPEQAINVLSPKDFPTVNQRLP
jgi:hypothetical protein